MGASMNAGKGIKISHVLAEERKSVVATIGF
jgi:hypothetical protein